MLPRPSTAVPSETTAIVLPLIVSVQADSGSSWIARRDARHAGRVGHREVVAGLDRDLAVDLDLAALVHQERAVRDARDLHALERLHRVDDALAVGGVDAGHGHVARDAALVDAHEVDRAEDRALVTDRGRHRGERARQLTQLDAHGEGVGGRGLEPRRRLQAGHGVDRVTGARSRRVTTTSSMRIAARLVLAARRLRRRRRHARASSASWTATRSSCASTAARERVRYIGVDTPESVKPGDARAVLRQGRGGGEPAARATGATSGSPTTPRRATATGACWPTSGAAICSSTPSSSAGLWKAAGDRAEPRARRRAAPAGLRRPARRRGLWSRC